VKRSSLLTRSTADAETGNDDLFRSRPVMTHNARDECRATSANEKIEEEHTLVTCDAIKLKLQAARKNNLKQLLASLFDDFV
jgi:hypothetical protein